MPLQGSQGANSAYRDRARTYVPNRPFNSRVRSMDRWIHPSERNAQQMFSTSLRASSNEIIRILDEPDENSARPMKTVAEFQGGTTIFSQGAPANTILYVQRGDVKLSVFSEAGKEAVAAVLGPGDFFGEGCLTGQSVHGETATAITPTTIRVIEKSKMLRLLREKQAFSERFISYMIARNSRIEADLIDQLFNCSEKRLARALVRLARHDEEGLPQRIIPRISQEMLAQIIGTTRSRVNFFMNKFRKLGFIEYSDRITINRSLLSVLSDTLRP
jgi:CRP/FNR family transcriptional regulator, cyclic AMP receptor protein